MRILLATDVIHAGGAETFVLRLGQALTARGHQVFIFPLYKNRIDYLLVQTLAPDVTILPAKVSWLRGREIADGLFRRLGLDISLLGFSFARSLCKVLRKQQVEVVHSHLFTTDLVAVGAGKQTGVPVVTTIHGDYSAYSKKHESGTLKRIYNFPKKMVRVLTKMRGIVCICAEHELFFQQRKQLWHQQLPLYKIYNGFEKPNIPAKDLVSRSTLHIPEHAFVFCMVARGIPGKGWLPVIEGFKQLKTPNAFLLLIGDSDYVQSLKDRHTTAQIIFLGKQEQPFRYLQIADVGMFCSTILTEALPTVIIEYLAAGLPVISTHVGEAGLMLQGDSGMAGIIIDPEKDQLSTRIGNAMKDLYLNPTQVALLKEQTAGAYEKFRMADCVRRYEQVYLQALSN